MAVGGARRRTAGGPAATRRVESGDVRRLAVRSRCSAARMPRSGPKSAACTRARRWRSCSRLPSGRSQQRYLLMDSFRAAPRAQATKPSLFHGIDTTIPGLASLARGTPPPALVAGLRAIADHVAAAQKAFDIERSVRDRAVRFSRVSTPCERSGSSLRPMGLSAEARFNIDARLKTKEDQFTEAAVLAHGLRVEVLADDGVVVPGQDVRVADQHRRPRPARDACRRWRSAGFRRPATCPSGPLEVGAVYRCDAPTQIPADARITKPYWKPLPDAGAIRVRAGRAVRAAVPPDAVPRVVHADGRRHASCTSSVQSSSDTKAQQLEGEKRMELTVVPRAGAAGDAVDCDCARGPWRDGRCRSRGPGHGRESRRRARPPARCAWMCRRAGRRPRLQAVTFTREDEAQTVRFIAASRREDRAGAVHREIGRVGRRADVRDGISGCRVSAHPAQTARDSRVGRRKGDGRAARAESHHRLCHGHGRRDARGSCAAWARRSSCWTPTSWHGAT